MRFAFDAESLDREFPSRRVAVQFNHAAVCPLPHRSARALSAYAERLSLRGGLDYQAWKNEADEVRRLASLLIGADASVGGAPSIAIVPNTTWGLNLVASGLDWRPGDVVVTTATEFPANLSPWLGLESRGVVVRRIPTRDGAYTADEVIAACDARTRLVALSAVAFHTGFPAPVKSLGAFCRSRGILFGLDAIQAVGVIPIDVAGSCVDFLSADGHKWMLGPEGCGILFTTPALRERLTPPSGWTNLVRGHPLDYSVPETPRYVTDATRFEVGALPTPGVYALAESLRLLLEIGLPTITQRITQTLAPLRAGLPGLGFTPVRFEGTQPTGILAAHPPAGKNAWFFAKRLAEESIVISAREGLVRFSPHVGNDALESERILESLARLV
ncbi:MAG: aminotransferase class V-fold PLP-dependent enzyme [Thermoanaerobaculia bacterium]